MRSVLFSTCVLFWMALPASIACSYPRPPEGTGSSARELRHAIIMERDVQAGGKCGIQGGNAVCAAGLCCSEEVCQCTGMLVSFYLSRIPSLRITDAFIMVHSGHLRNRGGVLRVAGVPVQLWSGVRRQCVAFRARHLGRSAAGVWGFAFWCSHLPMHGSRKGGHDV